MDMQTEVRNLDAWIGRFKNGPKIATEETTKAGQRSGFMVERKAKGRVLVWRGGLRRSITTKTTTTAMVSTTKVGTNSKYGKEKEFGRPSDAKMPPPGALLPWMAAKGIAATTEDIKGTRRTRNDKGEITGSIISGRGFVGPRRGYLPIEYLIARAIKRKAPQPHPFLLNSFNELQPQIKAEFKQARGRIIARLKAGG